MRIWRGIHVRPAGDREEAGGHGPQRLADRRDARRSALDVPPHQAERAAFCGSLFAAEKDELCARDGWIAAASWGGNGFLRVYYNEQPDPVSIETDPVVQTESIYAAMKKR